MLISSKRCFKALKIMLCVIVLLAPSSLRGGAQANEDKLTVAVVEFQVKGDTVHQPQGKK